MGFSIRSRKTKQFVSMSVTCWRKALELAELYGWEPGQTQCIHKKGFQSLVSKPPSGILGYLKAGVSITTEDARQIGVALKKGYPNIQTIESEQAYVTTSGDKVEKMIQDRFIKAYAIPRSELKNIEVKVPNSSLHPHEYFGGSDQRMLIYRLIQLCETGSLLIDDRTNQEVRMTAEKYLKESGSTTDIDQVSISEIQLP